jgi:hypothetical protein
MMNDTQTEATHMTQTEADQLNAAKIAIRAQWEKACATEGVPVGSMFVVFGNTNADAIEHNRLMGEFFKLRNRIARKVARREARAVAKNNAARREFGLWPVSRIS